MDSQIGGKKYDNFIGSCVGNWRILGVRIGTSGIFLEERSEILCWS